MEKLIIFVLLLGIVSSVLLSCDNTYEPFPDDGWMGNWDRPHYNDISFYKCKQQCTICGKCLGNYEETVCQGAETCADDEGYTKYVFDTTDEKVKIEGLIIEDTWVGGLDSNEFGEITYTINSSENAVVKFGVTVSRNQVITVTNNTPIFINGEKFISCAGNPQVLDWYTFDTIWLGCIVLNEGLNVITMSNPSGGLAYNVKNFTFLSDSAELTLVESHLHESTRKNATVLYTDYECGYNVE